MTQLVIPWDKYDDFYIWYNDPVNQVVGITAQSKTVKVENSTFKHANMFLKVSYRDLPMPDKQHKRAARYAIRTGDKELYQQVIASVIARHSKAKSKS